jgi:ribosomal protein S18 acetylase RimI-like enzyme
LSNSGVELLDHVVWNALTTHHAGFALGDELGRRYPSEMSPLAGVREPSEEAFASLARVTAAGDFVALFFAEAPATPPGWKRLREVPLVQMVWEGGGKRKVPVRLRLVETRRSLRAGSPLGVASLRSGAASVGMTEWEKVEALGREDVEEMLVLTELTKPGPFSRRTIEFGQYFGIRHEGRLVAMAGERLRVPGFTEVSAVCTHPEFTGRGYARAVMAKVMQGIVGRGECPFLHAAEENARAIGVYEELGFRVRWTGTVVVLGR